MPFTQAYTKQLTELSAQIEKIFTQLHQESLVAFASPLGVKLSKKEPLKSLLNKALGDFTPNEQAELVGKKSKELDSRQHLFVLSQVWNKMAHLHENIKQNVITTPEKLTDAIENILIMLEGEIAPFIENTFKSNPLSRQKIGFVRNFIALAHRLLQKQLAIQQLLAANIPNTLPTHTDNKQLNEIKTAYNKAITQYNNEHLSDITAYENAIRQIEVQINAIKVIQAELETEIATLKRIPPETTNLQAALHDDRARLNELLEKSFDENTTIDEFNQLDDDIETSATHLITTMQRYQTTVINTTKTTAETIKKFAAAKKGALAGLIDKAESIIPKERFAEEKARDSLANLTTHYHTLENAMTAEIRALAEHSDALTTLKTKHHESATQAQQALQAYRPLLLDTDAETLKQFELACEQQHDTVADIKAAARISTPWNTLHTSLTKQFATLNEQHRADNALSSPHLPQSVIDKSAITKIEKAIEETGHRSKALNKQKETAAREHKERKERVAHFNHDMKTLVEQTDARSEQCEAALETLTTQMETLIASQTREKALASELLRQANQLRRELVFTDDKKSRLSKLKAAAEKADFEAGLLKLRIVRLQTKVDENQFTFSENSRLNPATLLRELGELKINPALRQTKKKSNDSSLEELRNRTDQLENKVLSASQNHHYRRKGTLVGGLAGITVSLLLLGGLVASIVFAFPIMLPLLIGVGVVIALTPGITGAIGRFFGKRKDNKILTHTQHATNANETAAQSLFNTSKEERTLARQESVRHQAKAIEGEAKDQAPEASLKAERKKGSRLNPKDRIDSKRLTRSSAYLSLMQSITEETTDDVAPSFDPAHPPTDSERAARSKTQPKRKTVHFSETTEDNQKAVRGLENSGLFSSLTSQPMQGETSEPVLNAHRPG